MSRRVRGRFDPRLAVVGLGGGLLAGLLGVGGGLVMIPLMVLWLGYDQRRAHMTSLGAIAPIAVGGLLGWLGSDSIRLAPALALAAGAVLGARAGAAILARVPERPLQIGFGCFLLAVAASTLLFHPTDGTARIGSTALLVASVPIGYGIGVAAAVLGVGGGLFIVPWLVLAGGFTQHEAEATSLLVILPTAISGTLAVRRSGFPGTRDAVVTGTLGAAAGFAGGRIAVALPGDALRIAFAVLIAVVGVRLIATRDAAPRA